MAEIPDALKRMCDACCACCDRGKAAEAKLAEIRRQEADAARQTSSDSVGAENGDNPG